MTTYKLITEQELQQAIDALQRLTSHLRRGHRDQQAFEILRAVQEREGPKLTAWSLRRKRDDFVRGNYNDSPTRVQLEIAAIEGEKYVPLYTLPEPPRD